MYKNFVYFVILVMKKKKVYMFVIIILFAIVFSKSVCVADWNNLTWCDSERVYSIWNWLTWCCPRDLTDGVCNASLEDVWIKISTSCLLNWQCGLNVYKVMWIRKSNEKPTVMWLIQDVVLAATTFVWTVLVVVLVFAWVLFALWSITWKDTKRAKSILIDGFIWLLLVMWSYAIIRLIQFLATAWS